MVDTKQLDTIHQKLQQLLKQYQLLQKENAQLKKELEKSTAIIQRKSEEINSLQQKMDVLKLNVGALYPDDKVALQKRIDSYLKEIDKCISLINAQ